MCDLLHVTDPMLILQKEQEGDLDDMLDVVELRSGWIDIVKMRIAGRTLKSIAEEFGVSATRISDIEKKVYRLLRSPARAMLVIEARGCDDDDHLLEKLQRERERYNEWLKPTWIEGRGWVRLW